MPPPDIARIAAAAGVKSIEWSGDTHVPAGKTKTAENVGKLTRAEGLTVAAYGSYYRVGCDAPSDAFQKVTDTAMALGAKVIRVFAGETGSKVAREYVWRKVIDETQRIADLAQRAGLALSFEFQANTLNDCGDSSRRLMESIERENVYTYWQPDPRLLHDEQLEGLDEVVDFVSNVHVFHWVKGRRVPLTDGQNDWRRYLGRLTRTKRDHTALIEFVQDDLPARFKRDAGTLLEIVESLPSR